MPRPRRDGAPAQAARRKRLTELGVRSLKPEAVPYLVWDTLQRGLAIRVQPTGRRAWKVIYHCRGRPRWYHLGDVGLADARRLAARVMLRWRRARTRRQSGGPARRRHVRGTGRRATSRSTPSGHNKCWKQADALVRRHLLPGGASCRRRRSRATMWKRWRRRSRRRSWPTRFWLRPVRSFPGRSRSGSSRSTRARVSTATRPAAASGC